MSVMAHLLAFLAGTLIRERDDMAGLGRRARGRSRVGAAILPVGQELRFCFIYARGPPARDDPELRVNVDRDRPEPPQLGAAVSVFIDAPHVAAILNDHVIEPIPIGRG
jgi:hypothetical protein